MDLKTVLTYKSVEFTDQYGTYTECIGVLYLKLSGLHLMYAMDNSKEMSILV